MNKANLVKGASWFFAVAGVVTLLIFLTSGLLENHLFDLLLLVAMLFIISDIVKKYKAEKKKWHLPALVFFLLICALDVIYFALKLA